jgi:hypothetical protein
LKQVSDMNESYTLVQQDTEVRDIQKDIGIKKNFFQYLFVKVGDGEYLEIFGTDNLNLESNVFRIYTTNFNKDKSN